MAVSDNSTTYTLTGNTTYARVSGTAPVSWNGNYLMTTGSGNMSITLPSTTTGTTFTWNGNPADPTQFMTAAEKVEYQQNAYVEPRDHEYNPGDNFAIFDMNECLDCYSHNMHRFSGEKHLFVIQEEEDQTDWLSRLAS